MRLDIGTGWHAIGLLLAGLACGVGCSPGSDFYDDLHVWVTAIRDGDGRQVPRGSDKSFFALHMAALSRPCEGERVAAAMQVDSSTFMGGTKYPVLLDAYIDYGPVEALAQALLEACRKAEPGSSARLEMASAFLDLRGRQYLWRHPESAPAVGMRPCRPPKRGWSNSTSEMLTKAVLAQGDRNCKAVWEEYQRHLRLLRDGRLRSVRWEDGADGGKK